MLLLQAPVACSFFFFLSLSLSLSLFLLGGGGGGTRETLCSTCPDTNGWISGFAASVDVCLYYFLLPVFSLWVPLLFVVVTFLVWFGSLYFPLLGPTVLAGYCYSLIVRAVNIVN